MDDRYESNLKSNDRLKQEIKSMKTPNHSFSQIFIYGRDFNPKPDSTLYSDYYYPSFALYTKEEIEVMSDKATSSMLSVSDGTGTYVAFGLTDLPDRYALVYAPFGFRLCQETEEKAMYFGQQFIELWAEYLAFNFTTGERIKI